MNPNIHTFIRICFGTGIFQEFTLCKLSIDNKIFDDLENACFFLISHRIIHIDYSNVCHVMANCSKVF